MARNPDKQVFNQSGRKHYRRTYSLTEVKLGGLVIVVLVAIAAWVAWRGAHPDPELFAPAPPQADRGKKVDRGPLPTDLTPEGWVERSLSSFDPSNVYVKINGREGFYKSFGFKALYFVSLQNESDPTRAVDIELYDLGTRDNALGCYAQERGEDAQVETHEGGLHHTGPNAMFGVVGPLYMRAIGTADAPDIHAVLKHVLSRFTEGAAADALPWGYTFFGKMGVDVGNLSFVPQDAFSLEAADAVFVAGIEGDLELFASRPPDAEAAAKALLDGFASYGEPKTEAGQTFVVDRYLSTYTTAEAAGPFVVGVRGAESATVATGWLKKLKATATDNPALGAGAPTAPVVKEPTSPEEY